MKYWIEWTAVYEGFTYSEAVTAKELEERKSDSSIKITYIEQID